MILEVSWDGLWRLSFGLPQFHGHGSWLVCEVALANELNNMTVTDNHLLQIYIFGWTWTGRHMKLTFGGILGNEWGEPTASYILPPFKIKVMF